MSAKKIRRIKEPSKSGLDLLGQVIMPGDYVSATWINDLALFQVLEIRPFSPYVDASIFKLARTFKSGVKADDRWVRRSTIQILKVDKELAVMYLLAK